MILVDHPNVLKSHCSFVSDHNLWVVMPFMSGGSCLHILKAAYPDGFEEVVIATILREILKGLDYLHHHGHIHRDVKVSILLFSIIQIYLCCIACLVGQCSSCFLVLLSRTCNVFDCMVTLLITPSLDCLLYCIYRKS